MPIPSIHILAKAVMSASSSQPAAAMRGPPTPTKRARGRCLARTRMRFAACVSPLASAAVRKMVGASERACAFIAATEPRPGGKVKPHAARPAPPALGAEESRRSAPRVKHCGGMNMWSIPDWVRAARPQPAAAMGRLAEVRRLRFRRRPG